MLFKIISSIESLLLVEIIMKLEKILSVRPKNRQQKLWQIIRNSQQNIEYWKAVTI